MDTWLETHNSTMSQDVLDIHGERADFAEVWSGGKNTKMIPKIKPVTYVVQGDDTVLG